MTTTTIAQRAKEASQVVAQATAEQRNAVIHGMSDRLATRKFEIIAANLADVAEATMEGIPNHLVDRLGFGEEKIDARIRALRKIEALPDPVGHPYGLKHLPNGLEVMRVRVPLGVVLMIYEARPHVTVNAGALCLKSANSAILRGGSEAKRCNELLGALWGESLAEVGLPSEAIQVVSGSHEEIRDLLQENGKIDLVIPRGGKDLIEAVNESSKIPVIKHYSGVCHVYVDRFADVEKAVEIALDSKCLMPEVCNAMETLLVCQDLASEIPRFMDEFNHCGVEVRGCGRIRELAPNIKAATEEDWSAEYLDNIVSIRAVTDVEEAIDHINSYGSHHTDAIVTENAENADMFVQRVDSAVVLRNASTMFCDGESLGMGAEIGISTDKLHARGPMGAEELTSYKLVICGDGHVMGDPKTFVKEASNH
ncbi:MAG: glutamate-5-semialdehyde dehydrogenase [Planctomycetota bacterium]|nr:glutamate-5-semialdehyde dehydrogenase [Planctomycetota bacterium]